MSLFWQQQAKKQSTQEMDVQNKFFEDYKTAYASVTPNAIADLLGISLKWDEKSKEITIPQTVTQPDGKVETKTIASEIKIQLPSPDHVIEGKFYYSENMANLVRMQEQLAQALALENISGLSRSDRESVAFGLMMKNRSLVQTQSPTKH